MKAHDQVWNMSYTDVAVNLLHLQLHEEEKYIERLICACMPAMLNPFVREMGLNIALC
jgi:hypothetical protein